MKKVLLLLFLFLYYTETCFPSLNSRIDSFSEAIKYNDKKVAEIQTTLDRYGEKRDIEYYEKSLEKHEYLLETKDYAQQALRILKECKEKNEHCNFQGNISINLSLNQIDILLENISEEKRKEKRKVEELSEIVEHLLEQKKEIEANENMYDKNNIFSVEESDAVTTNHKEEVSYKPEDGYPKIRDKEILKRRINTLTQNYTKKQKDTVYRLLLSRLFKYPSTKKVSILIEVLQEKLS